jgi:ATP-dependent RNA helicase RhlE
MTFRDLNLNKLLLNAIDDLEYTTPTPIQVEAFPIIMSGRDVVGIAQTGTGKTFAYLLPLLRGLKFSKESTTSVLIIVPTRELVLQVAGEVEKLTKYMTVRTGRAYGGTNIKTQQAMLREGVDVMVATPGRLLDLIYSRSLKAKHIKKLVIDEVDEMLNLGFRAQLLNILDLLPPRRQNLLFSATMTDDVESLLGTFFNAPHKIEIEIRGTPVDKIQQSAYHVPNFNTKVNLLKYLLRLDESMTRVLIFIGTKKLADMLYERLKEDFEEDVSVIHSNKSQNFRMNSISEFHNGGIKFLVATDIIARGVDISEVTHVINFDMPEAPESYIHRIGRTGRADREGVSIAFITSLEQECQMRVETLMKKLIPLRDVPIEVEISKEMLPYEIPSKGGDKNYLLGTSIRDSQGAFHEKKLKNTKVNLAHEKRKQRKIDLGKLKRKPKK